MLNELSAWARKSYIHCGVDKKHWAEEKNAERKKNNLKTK